MERSIFYQNPFLYKLGLWLVHRANLAKRYKFLTNFVEKGDLILEPGCGPALLADFLPRDCLYFGFDQNEDFVDFARQKYPGVYKGDFLNPESFFSADIVIACDLLHHLKREEKEKLIENCWKAAKKKFIICEPFREGKQRKWWFEFIERDGKNKPRLEDFWDEETLRTQMENGFLKIANSYLDEISKIGKDLIAVYTKEGK